MLFFGLVLLVLQACLIEIDTISDFDCPESESNEEEISFLRNPDNCTNFYVCSNGKPIELSCSQGLYFNPDKNVSFKNSI